MNAYQILRFFNENEFLETSNDLDDREISLFIDVNRNVNTTKMTKTDLKSVKETTAIEEIPAEDLNNLSDVELYEDHRSENLSFVCQSQETEPIFSQEIELSSTNAQLLSVRNLHRNLIQNDAWLLIRTKMTELEVRLNS